MRRKTVLLLSVHHITQNGGVSIGFAASLAQILSGAESGVGYLIVCDLNIKPLHAVKQRVVAIVLDFRALWKDDHACLVDSRAITEIETGSSGDGVSAGNGLLK